MKPIIGITVSAEVKRAVGLIDQKTLFVSQEHANGVINAGGIPYLLPFTTDPTVIASYVEQLDGLLLTGGWDVDPQWYNQDPLPQLGDIAPERDRVEMAMTKAFLEANKPILGICRGHQVLAVALGCTLYQDIASQLPEASDHQPKMPRNHPMHSISIARDSQLYQLVGSESIRVNSMHHQAIRDVSENIWVTAKAQDGIIEAFESRTYPNTMGVQWHPECMIEEHEHAQLIFNWLIEKSVK